MKKIIIPLKEEVEAEVIDGDWTGYFEKIQNKLNNLAVGKEVEQLCLLILTL